MEKTVIERDMPTDPDEPIYLLGGEATGSTPRGAPDSESDPGGDAAGSTPRGAPNSGSDVSMHSEEDEVTAHSKNLRTPAPQEVWVLEGDAY